MPFKIVRNDLTKMQVDAIVNTANAQPIYSSGTDTAVYKAAGDEELLAERKKIGYLNEGEVAITPGFKLPAKYIIHAVSPRYRDGNSGEEEKLRSCYEKSLEMAVSYKCESIAFPLIATGSFGYPKEEGMRIALDEINAFLMKYEMLVYLVVFDTAATKIGRNLYPNLEAYIDHNYVCKKREEEYGNRYLGSVPREAMSSNVPMAPCEAAFSKKHETREHFHLSKFGKEKSKTVIPRVQEDKVDYGTLIQADYDRFIEAKESALEERMHHMTDTFQQYLLYLIESKKLKNADVYKRAIVTKQLFSKIKLNPNYHPDKATAMRLCVGAKLNLDETKDLLARAGYALSPCDKQDIIFSFFIENQVYDMIEIAIALEDHGLPSIID